MDVVKFVAIFFVLWGHVIAQTTELKNPHTDYIYQFIYTFHMPLFMGLCGFLFSKSLYGFRNNISLFLHQRMVHRLISLIIPTASFGFIKFLLWGECIESKLTAYAWEKMFYKGRHIFWKNNELAGEAAILNAFQCYGMLPWKLNVAVLGKGNTAKGAVKALNMLGAEVTQYDHRMDSLLREEIYKYDVIVNCVLWDVFRNDHIIYRDDLKRMKKGSFIIDVSCDKHGAIETSIPTTISNPVYAIDGIAHYVVDHTPAIFFKTFSAENSKVILPYLDILVSDTLSNVLRNSLIIKDGTIVDEEIIKFQKR